MKDAKMETTMIPAHEKCSIDGMLKRAHEADLAKARREGRLAALEELEKKIEARIKDNGYRSFSMRLSECVYILSIIKSMKEATK